LNPIHHSLLTRTMASFILSSPLYHPPTLLHGTLQIEAKFTQWKSYNFSPFYNARSYQAHSNSQRSTSLQTKAHMYLIWNPLKALPHKLDKHELANMQNFKSLLQANIKNNITKNGFCQTMEYFIHRGLIFCDENFQINHMVFKHGSYYMKWHGSTYLQLS
jgi:hypothetical protein